MKPVYITTHKTLFKRGIIRLTNYRVWACGQNITSPTQGTFRKRGKDWHYNLDGAELRANHIIDSRMHMLEQQAMGIAKDGIQPDGRSVRKPVVKIWK